MSALRHLVDDQRDRHRRIPEDRRTDLNVARGTVKPDDLRVRLHYSLAPERSLNRVRHDLTMLGMKQIHDRHGQNLIRMRSAEQTDSCWIDVDRAEVPAEQYAIGKRLDEIAKQTRVFVADGAHEGSLAPELGLLAGPPVTAPSQSLGRS